MAIESNDALTKLSANLAMYRNFHKDEDRVNDYILTKAQRIIAKLAEVSGGHWENICDGPPVYICHVGDLKLLCCIGRCCEIAEEKTNNESSPR